MGNLLQAVSAGASLLRWHAGLCAGMNLSLVISH